ncbi:MAG: D-alanyl-D-alanine carboxypeptidase [Comamonadaceae bacterium]|nr:D-alanyl-D-alanine carboxypeptidase [Comamonadaceae bacterium]
MADARSTPPARSVGVSKWLATLPIAAFCASALAQNVAPMPAPSPAPGPRLAAPEPYLAALRSASIPASSVGMVIQPIGSAGGGLAPSALNETLPLNPASAMKLVTTYAALDLLGPAYTWRTEAFAAGALRRDVLEGDLVIRGSGDPKLVIENLWLMVQRIRGYGMPRDPRRRGARPLRLRAGRARARRLRRRAVCARTTPAPMRCC